MATNHFFQLKRCLLGDVAADGGMGTALTEKFGETVINSMVFVGEAGTETTFNIEEHDDAVEAIQIPGLLRFSFATHNTRPAGLINAFGGTLSGVAPNQIWHAPAQEVSIEQSIRAETKAGIFLEITRIKLTATPDFSFSKTRIGQINFTGILLAPTKAGESKYRIGTIV